MDCTPVTAPSVRFVSATGRFVSRRPIKSVFTDEKVCKAFHCFLIGLLVPLVDAVILKGTRYAGPTIVLVRIRSASFSRRMSRCRTSVPTTVDWITETRRKSRASRHGKMQIRFTLPRQKSWLPFRHASGDSLGRLLSELTRSYYGFDTRGQPPSSTRHSVHIQQHS